MSPGNGEADGGMRMAPDGFDSWNAYWTAQRMPWRTEPEIDGEQQRCLAERLNVQPDDERGVYPFKGIALTRADIEWLLSSNMSKSVRGPVDWGDVGQRRREGPDLRGTILMTETLEELPLARAKFTGVDFTRVMTFAGIHLEGATLLGANLSGKHLQGAHLEGADLKAAHLDSANLFRAHLEGAILESAHLEEASLIRAHLERAQLKDAQLAGADLTLASMDGGTSLEGVTLSDGEHGAVRVAGTRWDGVSLAVVNWGQLATLGDDLEAERKATDEGSRKDDRRRLQEYQAAARANRQLATALRTQGFNEPADHFAYRAEYWNRRALYRDRKWGPWFVSWVLAALSGYGYNLWRILAAYGIVVAAFALAYFLLGLVSSPHVTWYEALLASFTDIHGRVGVNTIFPLLSVQQWLAALESVIGIVIEGVFVAMLVQRFFGGK